MIIRCYHSKSNGFHNYGGRGISVYGPWRDSFQAFLDYMGPRPAGTTLDRFPNKNGNYEPGNVRWADNLEQGNNRRNNRLIEHLGQTLTVAEWCRRLGMKRSIVDGKLRRGVPFDAIVRVLSLA